MGDLIQPHDESSIKNEGYIPSVYDRANELLRASMRGDRYEARRVAGMLDRETRDHFLASLERARDAIVDADL